VILNQNVIVGDKMEPGAITINDQPISAGFFKEGKWLSDYITPNEPNILVLYENITQGLTTPEEKIVACWDWVANEVKYKNFIAAQIYVEGKSSFQRDFWQSPTMCSETRVGNCANKAFLLTSLVRNILPPEQVFCVLGNLMNGHAAGHAWVEATLNGRDYILEATRNDVPMIETQIGDRYESVHYFNDVKGYVMPGRTVLTPFQACYSNWLKDYLNWTYIQHHEQ
jgi:transglutaminase-like putative cysteine protease